MAILRQSLILPNMTKDLVPLFIQILIVRAGSLPAPSGWDAGRNASGTQGITEPVGVITTVRQQRPGLGQSIYQAVEKLYFRSHATGISNSK